MRRRIDLDMQGAPQRNPRRCAVRCNILLGAHGALIITFNDTSA
jgi:hypothetical protein